MTYPNQGNGTQKALATCGIAAPILFAILVFIGGLLNPGYSQVSQAISRLGEVGTPNALVTDTNLVLTGLLIIAFVVGLYRSILQGRGSKLGPALLLAFPVTLVLQGSIFPLPSPVHAPLGNISFIITIIGLFVISRELGRDGQWIAYGKYSVLTGTVMIALFVIIIVGQDSFTPWFGLLQRIALAPVFLWVEVLAIKLLVISDRPRP